MTPQKPRDLVVKLISKPEAPLGTLFYVWEQSRSHAEVPMPVMLEGIMGCTFEIVHASSSMGNALAALGATMVEKPNVPNDPSRGVSSYYEVQPTRRRILELVERIFDEDIPCTEQISFTFAFENMSISLREQMVRHRIGVSLGENFAVDIIPDQTKSSWWSQTMRMLPMNNFYTEGRYMIPDSIKENGTETGMYTFIPGEQNEPTINSAYPPMTVEQVYLGLLENMEMGYQALVAAGVPMEDARQIIPLAASHGITWTMSLKAMMHIVGKRACWVAQANLWAQLIAGMVDHLCEQVHPIFRKIILPPCFSKGSYKACPYFQINTERVQGRDHMPPCPLYVFNQTQDAYEAYLKSEVETGKEATWSPPYRTEVGVDFDGEMGARYIENWTTSQEIERRMLDDNVARFEKLWKLDVHTGAALDHPLNVVPA